MITMRFYIALAALLAAGPAFAQSAPSDNVPTTQSVCNIGYEAAIDEGRLSVLTAEEVDTVDTNSDGRISHAEFNNACAKQLFKDAESTSG
jgi:hypothetical protein